MKKNVVFSIFKIGKTDVKWTGTSYIENGDLVVFPKRADGSKFRKVFDDIFSYCHRRSGDQNQFTGYYYEIVEKDFQTKFGSYEQGIIPMKT